MKVNQGKLPIEINKKNTNSISQKASSKECSIDSIKNNRTK